MVCFVGIDFPMFEYDQGIQVVLFTSSVYISKSENLDDFDNTDIAEVKSDAYDLVINGQEMAVVHKNSRFKNSTKSV